MKTAAMRAGPIRLSLVLCALVLASLPYESNAAPLRIGFGSCIDNPDSPVWGSLAAREPDLVMLLGDTIYLRDGEWETPTLVRQRYERLLNQSAFARLRATTRLFAIWDDHDYGPNDSDASFRHADVTKREFRRAFSANPRPPEGLTDFSTFSADLGDVEILALDSRSARRYPKPNREGTLFGAKQLEWLEERLRETSKSVVVIASPNQILPSGDNDELLHRYPSEFERVVAALKESPALPLILSGDRHYGEIVELPLEGKRILEVSSSPLTASPRQLSNIAKASERAEPPLVLHGEVLGTRNFGFVEIERAAGQVKLRLEVVPLDDEVTPISVITEIPLSPPR